MTYPSLCVGRASVVTTAQVAVVKTMLSLQLLTLEQEVMNCSQTASSLHAASRCV